MKRRASSSSLIYCSRLVAGGPGRRRPRKRRRRRAPYTVLTRDGRRPLATRVVAGQEMFALDDLAPLFNSTVREDAAAGGLTVTARNR